MRTATFTLAALGFVLSPLAQAANIDTKGQDLGTLSLPVSLTYGSTFTQASMALAGLGASDIFYEGYAFVIPEATFASITTTFDLADVLQISNLQARLYSGTLATVNATLVPWSTPITTGVGSLNAINAFPLSAGSYVLQVRGQVTGSAGGSYVGLMNISAVPEPETYAMLGAGLLAVGMMLRRQRQQQG